MKFLAQQGLAFRGDRDDKVDFARANVNRGNFIATLQLLGKGNSVLQKHLLLAKSNAKYTSKTIQNEIIHVLFWVRFGPTRASTTRGLENCCLRHKEGRPGKCSRISETRSPTCRRQQNWHGITSNFQMRDRFDVPRTLFL